MINQRRGWTRTILIVVAYLLPISLVVRAITFWGRGIVDGEATELVKGGADRRPEREGGEHRHANPGNDASCVRGTGKPKPPAHSSRNNQALGSAEQRPSPEQDRGG